MPFSSFDMDQVQKASRIIDMLFTKYDETQDLIATISYANKLQEGREVNNMVLRWALEVYIVHSNDAKRAGIRYPEPEAIDRSMTSDAAMVSTRRQGQPAEDWMNYWRNDADFNYHHRHWHVVYNRTAASGNPHLERQGELFGYMHSQMLARYDAERESWGLPPVSAFEYGDVAPSFNAGLEFHSDRQWAGFVPRPTQRWSSNTVSTFTRWQRSYNSAVDSGQVATGVEMTPNWSGHILEASSGRYTRTYGDYHNSGHGIFGSSGIPRNVGSYMNSPLTAVRDPIFFRWHKRIDDMWQANNDYYRSDLADGPPPVVITPDDIMLSTDRNPPVGFTDWTGDGWSGRASDDEAVLRTYLGPAQKKYEWDNKLGHEKFYYHLRLRRSPEASTGQDIPVTIRIFICPRRRQSDRRMWIEMDKFVCSIESGTDHIEVTRADVHSSVIKRLRRDLEGSEPDSERRFVRTLGGFCECGWPYDMLLPRGTAAGEDYVLCVIATDNRVDSIDVRTTCGSMSYCGARGQRYPDSRHMGYPFCNPITLGSERVNIPEVFGMIPNAAHKFFKIMNDTVEAPAVNAVDIWWPYTQLRVNDGTLRREPRGGTTEYIRSDLVGTFRVLIDNDAAAPPRGQRIIVRFQGRGSGGGAYVVRDAYLAQRRGNTLNVVSGTSERVLAGDRTEFAVPESGLYSDAMPYRFDPSRGDYFLTFTLDSGAVNLPASQSMQTSTYYIPSGVAGSDFSGDWTGFSSVYRRFSSIHAVSGLMCEM
uniref:Phenoloxidase n=1 Tax=Botryllus schlosseri TaxID=30301 RepID=A0A0S1S6G3_BOTSH|nr:phenoloxidase [Botryllus schlosseri]